MSIIRVAKQPNQFSIIDRTAAEDERLSMKAKGIMFYLLTKPDDWTLNVRDLINRSRDGRDSIYAGIKELRELGYISMRKYQDEKGLFKTEYIVYENPINVKEKELSTESASTSPENPDAGFPDAGFPDTEKPDNSNNEFNDNKYNDNNNNIDMKERSDEAEILNFLQNNLKMCYVNEHVSAAAFLREIYTAVIKHNNITLDLIYEAIQEWVTRDFNYKNKTNKRYEVKTPTPYFLDCLYAAAAAQRLDLTY